MNEDIIDVIEENVEDIVPVEEETVIVNTGGTNDHSKLKKLDYASSGHTGFASSNDLSNEETARQNAVSNLQNQIDAITVSSDVVDIVGTYQDLQNYDTTKLTDDDIIKVMQDSTHSNAMSYYRWNVTNDVGAWVYVGSEGPFYTKSESDTKYQEKLVSGTNIKTINDNSILGNGNLIIDPAGGANLTPLEVPDEPMNLYDFIMNAEIPETYTISNDNEVYIIIEKEAGEDGIWIQKGSIISVYPQYSATILSADGMYIYYIDWGTGEYLTGGGAVDYDTVVQIVDDTVDTSNLVDLTSDQTITGKKTFKDKGIEFSKTGYNVKTALEPATNGVSLTFTDAQGNKTTKLGVGSQYTTTDQDFIPRNDYSYNAMTGEYAGINLGKNDKKYNVLYARALSEDGQAIKPVANLLSNDKNLLPDSGSVRNIGSSSNRWYYLYLGGNIEMSLGDINQVRNITANEYRIKDGNYNNNYYSLLKYAYVNPGKTVAQLQNGIDVNNRVIHNIGTPDDDTSPISKGYADSHYQGTLTFDSTPTDGSLNPVTSDGVYDSIQNVIEVAEGKTATYTLSYATTGNTDFNSQNNSITVSSFTDTAGNIITDEDVKVGDIVLIVEVDVPDRWVQSIDTTNHTITFYKLETSKIDLNNYVDLTSDQTITGKKSFNGNINVSNEINFSNGAYSGIIKWANTTLLSLNSSAGIQFYATPVPSTNGGRNLGSSSRKWNNLYLAGSLNDGTNQTSVENINNNFAPIYDNTATYVVGNRVIYNGKLYRCTTAITTAEDWDSTHWTEASISGDYVTLDSSQEISGTKTFTNQMILRNNNSLKLANSYGSGYSICNDGSGYLNFKNNYNVVKYNMADGAFTSQASSDLGTSSKQWKDLYLSGNLSDGTNSVAVNKIANKDNFVTLSQADYDDLVDAGTVDANTFYFIEEE